MTISRHIAAAFRKTATIDGGKVTIGTRGRVDCILGEGIQRETETGVGSHRTSIYAQCAALIDDIGSPPRAGEKAVLEYAGRTYKLSVTDNDQTDMAGTIYNFTLAN